MEKQKNIFLENISEEWFEKNVSKKDGVVYSFVKRATDLFFGCVGFVFFVLLFPFFALVIKFDSKGNILFKQERIGKNGKIIVIRKFRTMLQEYNCDNEKWREKNKNNITRVGKFLRVSHLDELPQWINLIAGDLSFIGPRAEWVDLAKIFEKEIPFYKKRYLVKPGLIGWAQINFPASKSVKEAKEKFEYDLYYIKNKSLLLDFEIILKSIKLFLL